MLNKDLVTAVANKVSDEDSIILFDILKKNYPEEKNDIIYAIALSMLEEVEPSMATTYPPTTIREHIGLGEEE